MAKDIKVNDAQNRQTSDQSLTREPRQTGMTYAHPFGFGLTPGDLLRMNPFALMRRMTEEMGRGFFGAPSSDSGGWIPAVEVSQRGGNYTVSAELPGIDPKDVKVEVTGDAIVLEGQRESQKNEERGGLHVSERRYGSFYRSIPLPEGANAEQARARFENGMLEITVPVQEQNAQRRQIPIESASQEKSQTAGSPTQSGRNA